MGRRIIGGLAIVALVIAALAWWQASNDPARRARKSADRIAASIARGEVPQGTLNGPDDLSRHLAGMGTIPHEVRVTEVSLAGESKATLTLAHTWRIPGQQPWSYDARATLVNREGEWRLVWDLHVLAPGLGPDEGLAASRLTAKRGDILGEGGQTIVTERQVFRVGVDRAAGGDPTAAAKALAAALEIDPDRYAAKVSAAGPQAFVEALILRAGDPRLVEDPVFQRPEVKALKDTRPLPPEPGFAQPILGTVFEATAADVTSSKGAVRAGDLVGHGGLQGSRQATLSGHPGYVVRAVRLDGSGRRRDLHRVAPIDGSPVRTTLDVRLQTEAERTLHDIEPASAIVIVRPSDGHVLAAASGPGGKGQSTATLGQFAPGSTFKTVTMLALTRAGMTPDTLVECSPTIVVDGARFKNYDEYNAQALGQIPLRTAFANSCNTALMRNRARVKGDAIPQAATDLGLNTAPHLGVPAFLGDVPTPHGETDLSVTMIGQGRVLASPLGMATVAASVAEGHAVRPILVLGGSVAPNGGAIAQAPQLRDAMKAVVTQGNAASMQRVPGPPVLAKTGTAEYGNRVPPQTHSWMIAIQGDLAVCVFIADRNDHTPQALPVLRPFLNTIHQ